MAQDHRLQQQRFELKYLIPPQIAGGLRDFIGCYLEPDDFGVGEPDLSYEIHSLYLDSSDLKTHHATVNGTKNRFKLRLRYYDGDPSSPVFFELKSRVDSCIFKQRCGVRREAIPMLLAGQLPEPSHLISSEPRHLVALQRFNDLQLRLNARPRLHNSYRREAWVSSIDNSVRVTFDRNIRGEPYFQNQVRVEMTNPKPIFPEWVVLELKFTNRFPDWFKEMVRCFNLMQFSSAKYSEGVEQLGEARLRGEERYAWNRPVSQPSSRPPTQKIPLLR